ncbi:zinc-dependent peptidase [Lacinutrix neustonica]
MNQAEFFAVASEYFFERPDLFKKKHPDLYKMMVKSFNQKLIT